MNLAPFTDRSAPSAILKGSLTVQLMTTLLGLKRTATKMQCYTTIGWERSNVWLNSLAFFLKLTIAFSIHTAEDILVYKDDANPEWFWAAEISELDGRYVILSVAKDTSRVLLQFSFFHCHDVLLLVSFRKT
jgi:hypothetical protein